MLSNRRYMMLIQNATLIFLASFIAGVIFMIDLKTDSTVAVASMYSMVILYSWLLPGKYSSIYTAAICSLLTCAAVILTDEMIISNPTELSNINMVISLVVIWTCLTLVFIAQSSFSSLESINHQLTENSAELLEIVVELDEKHQELEVHKMQLEQLNENLQVKNRELERFTSIASHDLQEPLRTIGNMTQLISRRYSGNFDEKGKKILNYVNAATNRMTILIKGLLEFSRIGNKRETHPVDCQVLLNNIVQDFNAVLKSVNGRIKVTKLPSVKGNVVELHLLFQNLISNALKFKKQGVAPSVKVSAEESQTHIEFCVKDNGIGIETGDYEKVFFIFQRLHAIEEYEGTGLGLAYCRKIVELHGGKIWIDSKKGVGSSFYFTLAKNI
jgi:signal transduction histidine kinase